MVNTSATICNMDEKQVFNISAMLASIAIPLLTLIASVQSIVHTDVTIMRIVAIAGLSFLMAATWSFSELIELRNMTDVSKGIGSSKIFLLIGMICLFLYQVIQVLTVFQ
jgi:hypothetical protein